jgi:4-oxalocrotonate tautomerase
VPLVEIDVLEGRPPDELAAIGDAVHEAMVATLGVPQRDRFQILTQHSPQTLRFDRGYLEIARGDRFVLIRLTLASGRSSDVKRAFYARVAALLSERTGTRPEDVTIALVENEREDWSFGHGVASYLELPREEWR